MKKITKIYGDAKLINNREYIESVYCNLNPEDNGGETISLQVDFFDNGDKKDNIFCSYTFSLNSYSNMANIHFNCNLKNLQQAIADIGERYQKHIEDPTEDDPDNVKNSSIEELTYIDSQIEELQDDLKKTYGRNHCLSSKQIEAIRNMMADYAVSATMDSNIRKEAEEICAENYRIEIEKEKNAEIDIEKEKIIAKEKIRLLRNNLNELLPNNVDIDLLWKEVDDEKYPENMRQMRAVTVHGFKDWHPTIEEWQQMLNTAQTGANGECEVTVDGVTKTMREWQGK